MQLVRPDHSIRQKLSRVLLASVGAGLFVAGLLLAGLDLRRQAEVVQRDLRAQADIIGLASLGALSFDDAAGARENLSVLRANPDAGAAALYGGGGTLLAAYVAQGGAAVPPSAPAPGSALTGRWLEIVRSVQLNGRDVGTIYLRARHNLGQRAMEHLVALVAILALSLAAAVALASRLQRTVTAPLLSLAKVAEGIREGRFQLRAERASRDEVGALVDAFNAMLDELERRARVLESANTALRASEERYQLAVRGSSAGLWDWDLRAGTMFYSPRLKQLLGYGDDEFPDVPQSLRKVVDATDVPRIRAALRAHLLEGRPYQVEVPVRLKSGESRILMLAGTSLRDADGRAFRMAGSVIDITDRKRMEDALRAANEAKDRFLATLAHELRNPLAPIRTGVEILRAVGAPDPRAREVLATMDRQLGHLVRLIDDLLDISRVTNGKIRIDRRRMQLAAAIDAAVEVAQPAITRAAHRLHVDVPRALEVEADHTRLAQAIDNLLHNAAKYTPPGGTISVRAWRDGREAVIEVSDTGVGIPPDMLEQVFAMFAQVDGSLHRAQGGLGIGLSLVRSLIELHGGSVVAASGGPGMGSTFTVRLPCLPAVPAPAPAPSGAQPGTGEGHGRPAAGRRILVVDDNVDAAQTLAAILEMLGNEVQCVHDGPQVLDVARAFRPDAVLLDIGLPGMSGHEVARCIRSQPALEGVQLVAVTGWGSEADLELSRQSGFDGHLTKPVEIEDLLRLLDAADAPRLRTAS